MKLLLVSMLVLCWQVEKSLSLLFCELPVEGIEFYYNCMEDEVPDFESQMQIFSDCYGKTAGEAFREDCCKIEHDEEKLSLCWGKNTELSKLLSEEEKRLQANAELKCAALSLEAYKEEMGQRNGDTYTNCDISQ